ncbi:preprotein translocase subunit YajC [Rhizobium sp. KVB221]|uniref:Sec translocon accessory complex subunit YajC n=1 Tax=Rhizobium setariae TaxID=2801340 RepID=A0A936YQD1_9HYPH|nr:preprotein translocase subunit YajC [Rhizobium setariae]MBL0374879.1 preprotein translocase subunit YajC [Rhizobium setariae]
MFFTEAFAQSAAPSSSSLGSGFDIIILFVPMLVVFYFLIFRPQRQQVKKREEILKNIRRGDQIVLGGGMIAKVTKVVDDNELEAEISDGVKVRVARSMIAEVRVKSEPVKEPTAANKP